MKMMMGKGRRFLQRVTHNEVKPSDTLIFNEAVNFEKQCIFVAIPKTGSTSVRMQIRPHGVALIPNSHLDIKQIRDSLYVYFLKNALGRNISFPSQHVPHDDDIRQEANSIFASFFKFSSVRNPWARAISIYLRKEGIQVRDKMTFEEFCDQHLYASDTCLHPTLHQNQADWLCDETGKIIMDYVYKLEEFSTAVKEIEERTDARLKLVARIENENPDSYSRQYKEFYSEHTKKLIAQRFQKDIDTFKYTF